MHTILLTTEELDTLERAVEMFAGDQNYAIKKGDRTERRDARILLAVSQGIAEKIKAAWEKP